MALRVPVASTRKTAMTRERWWWSSLAGLLLLAGIVGGCGGDDHDGEHHDGEHHAQGRCILFAEREPNDTPDSTGFLRNNCLRVGTPPPLRPYLCFATQGHPMTHEAVMRCSPSNYAARSIM